MTDSVNSLMTNGCRALLLTLVLMIQAAGPCLGEVAAASGSPSDVEFVALDLEARRFSGAELKGRVVLLDFWADWCSPCVQAFPALTKLQTEYGEMGLDVVGIAVYSGTPRDVKAFLGKRRLGYRMLVGDDDLVERFDVIGYPTYLLIDREGRVSKKYVGSLAALMDEVRQDIERLLKE